MRIAAGSKKRVGAMSNWERKRSEELQAGKVSAGFDILFGPEIGNLGKHKTFVTRFGGRDK